MTGLRSIALTACVLATGGCATTTYSHQTGDTRIGDAFEKPFGDTGWTRESPPELLINAAEAPYAAPTGSDCSAVRNEVSALDVVLGPDLDHAEREDESRTDASSLLSGAIGGVIGLPYRGIVRRISGAERRERVLREAILAGMVRRAFLKGVAHLECAPGPVDHAAASPAAPEASPFEAPN